MDYSLSSNRRLQRRYRYVVSALLLSGVASTAAVPRPCRADGVNIERFIRDAGISYTRSFVLNTTLDRWHRILDNPVAMGALWERYGFQPAYRVSPAPGGFSVVDPTGIEGILTEIPSSRGGRRIFYGGGRMRNWFLPVSLSGKALIIVEQAARSDSVAVTVGIYGEGGDDAITRLLLKVISPVLTRCIDRRVTGNLRDLRFIVADMERAPSKISAVLDGEVCDAMGIDRMGTAGDGE